MLEMCQDQVGVGRRQLKERQILPQLFFTKDLLIDGCSPVDDRLSLPFKVLHTDNLLVVICSTLGLRAAPEFSDGPSVNCTCYHRGIGFLRTPTV